MLRALVVVAVVTGSAHAEPLPAGSIEVVAGMTSGAGADAKKLGYGYVIGAEASWQPMRTEKRWGVALRWSTLFGGLYDGTAENVNPPLRTVQMDLTAGVRFRPWTTRRRYLTARLGAGILRTNDPVDGTDRTFVGPAAAVGLDQYFGTLVVGVDVRYALVAFGPEQLALVVRIGVAGP
ncbi:MAG TPA: hypothetical protein VMJ10_26190 [Kofleriaceae bacterium]|nr:hypothetical protein [Kofleriaceae bacterium]